MLYCCHKCGGLLTRCDDPRPYHCGCISGYVRDWQEPLTLDEVRRTQIEACVERLNLYRAQCRPDRGDHVVNTTRDLMQWLDVD